ncbi:SGNH/GDSL hydrolase family protein [Pseudomonas nitroreducens]|uniref:SGNH/GDSL hydrolase family protein n=1 Tax=Pseudomonas nitroreducens TaxID=46680 RepID=UPI00265AAF2C|nr:SGNH/GDSL hydrolase family protein [Pseudomonas nitroreducens]MCP1651704.1 lysophospholipase L1-like esterase [Pseudomonas nitroreducens]MCP1684431.1 lysophospholipase L1-like esterase [Pseudomonas nitroreducens]
MRKLVFFIAAIASTLAIPAWSAVIIEQYGDSTTLGLTYNGTTYVAATPSAPDTLYTDLNGRFGGGSVVVYNKGVSSSCAKDLLNGTGSTQPFSTVMQTSPAHVVTLNYGMNDGYYCNQTPDQYQSTMTQLVNIAKARGKIVILEEPNPTTNPQNPNLYSYIERLSQVAISTNVPIIQHYRVMSSSNFWKLMLSDGIHPTSEGYTFKGRLEFQVISNIIQPLIPH